MPGMAARLAGSGRTATLGHMSFVTGDPSAALAIGLQEWAAVCRALGAGRLVLAVRKGGIHERGGGLFQLEHQRFALLPTYLHQDASRLRPEHAAGFTTDAVDPSPGTLRVACWAEVARIWKVADLARVQALDQELLWSDAELATRFRYRDQPWLYVVALRVHRLPAVQAIADHPSYAGCRSWIPLKEPISTTGSTPVLDDAVFASRLSAISAELDA